GTFQLQVRRSRNRRGDRSTRRNSQRRRTPRNCLRALSRRCPAPGQAMFAARSPGAAHPLDNRGRRRPVGIVSGSTADRSQPLIGATYYLSRALNPFADVRLAEGVAPAAATSQFLDRKLPMLILADVGNVNDALDQLNKWIDNGGVLVRFAGPHLAGADDKLVPVKLRRGGRTLGGSLSWDKPQQLAAFSREGPFN